MIAGVVLNCLLFSAMHANLAALPSLCVLAFALTVAYELTGCILVPMAMHALFNLTMFSVMLNTAAS
jgi:membrane protease YdiL (CAAX protease family)